MPKGGFFTFTLAGAMFSLIGEIKPFLLATIITLAFGFLKKYQPILLTMRLNAYVRSVNLCVIDARKSFLYINFPVF